MPGRVVQGIVGHVEHRTMGDQQLLERFQVHAVAITADGDDLGTVPGQIGVHREITRVVEQHRVAGFDQQAHQHVDGLYGVGGGDDLLDRHFDAQGRHLDLQGLAQWQVTAGVAVFTHAQGRRAKGAAYGFEQLFGRQPRRRQETGTRTQRAVVLKYGATDHAGGVLREQVRAGIGLDRGDGAMHVVPRALA
ncbi:hypothetical protein D3C80_1252310 [compost metagenome]